MRKRGDGSIFQRPNGTYKGYIWIKDNHIKRRKYISGKTYSDVQRRLAKFKHQNNQLLYRSNLTLGEQMKKWLLTYKRYSVSSRTFEANLGDFNRRINPSIGHLKSGEITTAIIQQEIINKMFKDEVNHLTKKKIYSKIP